MSGLGTIITQIVLIILLLMSLVPFLPAIPLIFLTMLIYGLAERFQHLTPLFLGGMLLITIASFFIDNIASWLGSRRSGASKYGLWGGLIGGVIGFLLDPVLGIIIGPFAGAFLAELIFSGHGWGRALKVGAGTLMGFAYGSAIRFILALSMILAFFIKLH